MMKKLLSLLLALALCLPLLPAAALAEDGTAGEDRPLYFCWNGDEDDPLTELRFEPRGSISGFFRIPLADGTFQRIDHKEVNIVFVPDEGTATDAISFSWDAEEEEWPSSVWFDTFGAGRLVYTDETGVRYSMAAACALPSEGFSTATTLTEETYLEHAAYCPLNQPFYFVFTENIQVTEVSAAVVRGSTATVTAEVLSDHPNVCSFVITNAVFSDQYVDGCLMLDASFLLADSSTWHTSFLFSDPAPRFGFQDADFPGHFFSSLNAEIRSVFSLNFGVDDQGVFRPVTVTSAVYVPEVDTRSDALAVCQTEDGWQLSSLHVGQGTLQCTAQDDTVYTLPITIVLPEQGFSTGTTLTEETCLVNRSVDYVQGQVFYYVFPAGRKITAVTPTLYDDNAQVQTEILSDQPNVCRFTLTACGTAFRTALDASFQLEDGSAWTDYIGLQNPAPCFGFRLYNPDGTFEDDLLCSVVPTVGLINRLGFFLNSGDESVLLDIASVAFLPAEGTAQDAMTAAALSNGVWKLSFRKVGRGTLQCTTEDNTVYTLPVDIILPEQGFSTATTLTEETYLPNNAYCPKDLSFYYVFPEGTVVTGVSAEARREEDESSVPVTAEVLSDQPNVCRFVLSAEASFEDGLDLWATFLLQNSEESQVDFLFLRDPAPRFGFRLYWRDESFSENLSRSVKTDAGFTNRLGFFLSSGDGSARLDIASVRFLPAEGTDADAMKATELSGGIWKLDSVLPGQGTLQCAARDGTIYTLPVDIALPSTGFFSERRRAAETYLPLYDFDETKTEHVVWYLTANGFSAGDITGWAGESKEDFLDSVERYITVEEVPWENSERFDIKLTIQSIPGCRLTVWPKGAYGGYELEILNTKKLESLPQLDAPTDLAWAGDYPGDMRCKSGALFQDYLTWTLYQVGNPEPLDGIRVRYYSYDPDSWRIDDLFWAGGYNSYPDRESGDYYFTVQAVGDEEQYKDSPVVSSPIWHYERPAAALAAPTDLHWEGQTVCWSDEGNRADDLYGYQIQFRCVAPGTGAETLLKYTLTLEDPSSGGLKHTLQDGIKDFLGSGTCQFRIRAVSGDITRIRHGQWSEYNGEDIQLTAPSQVKDALDDVLTEYQPKVDEGTQKLTDEDAEKLKSAVAEKKDELERTLCTGAGGSNGVADKLQELEALVGGPATVTVTGDAPEEIKDAQSGVSIVGASLNGTADVTLKIDKAETVSAETPINPAQYHNTIPFSMTLEGVNEEQQHQPLAVPVLITLPLPDNINPSFLVLLHKVGDTWQEIFPYQVFYDKTLERDCVRFTVTSFSDFAFAQRLFCGITATLWLEPDQFCGVEVCATADVKKVVAAVYDESGKQLGCAAKDANEGGGTLTLDLPALKTGAAVRVFFLNETGQPVCPAAEQNIRR